MTSTVALHYEAQGDRTNPTLLFIHGAGCNHRQFAVQQAAFANAFYTLSVSLRGHNGSGKPDNPGRADYTIGRMAADVLALLDKLNVERVHVVGNSLGGLVGYEMIQAVEHRIRSLTTFGTAGELHSPGLVVAMMTMITRLTGPRGMAWLTERAGSRNPDASRMVGEMFRAADKQALLYTMHAVADYDYTHVVRDHDVPVMIIRGSLDTDINKNLESTLAVLKPTDSVVDLDDAGHFANLDQPERFNDILRDFLQPV